MNTVTLEQAQASLSELLHSLPDGAELFITEQGSATAKMTHLPGIVTTHPKRVPNPGFARGQIELKPGWDGPSEEEFPAEKL